MWPARRQDRALPQGLAAQASRPGPESLAVPPILGLQVVPEVRQDREVLLILQVPEGRIPSSLRGLRQDALGTRPTGPTTTPAAVIGSSRRSSRATGRRHSSLLLAPFRQSLRDFETIADLLVLQNLLRSVELHGLPVRSLQDQLALFHVDL